MIGRRVAIELFHIVAGIGIALTFAYFAAWAVPLARGDIWTVDAIAIAAVILMGLKPLREAHAADRAAGEGRAAA